MGMVDPSTVRALLWVLCSFLLGGMAISVFLDTPIPSGLFVGPVCHIKVGQASPPPPARRRAAHPC